MEVEEQFMGMDDPIDKMEGVGEQTLRVLRAAGFRTFGELHCFNAEDRKIQGVINEMRVTDPRTDAYWRRMGTRCANIIFRARSAQAAPEVPEQFLCPLTLDWMEDPVVTPAGHSYSRQALLEHLKTNPTDPFTRDPLTEEQLYPNRSLRDAIDNHRRHHLKYAIVC